MTRADMAGILKKAMLREYGIFLGFVLGALTLTAVAVIFTRGAQRDGLRAEIERTLDEKEPGVWTVGDFVSLASPLELSAACFSARGDEDGYALIMRVETLYGPFPAVFTYTENRGARFSGFAALHGRVVPLAEGASSWAQLRHWERRIQRIIEDGMGARNE